MAPKRKAPITLVSEDPKSKKQEIGENDGATNTVAFSNPVETDSGPSEDPPNQAPNGLSEAELVIKQQEEKQRAEDRLKYQQDIENLEKEREQLSDNTHPEIIARSVALKKLCDRKSAAAAHFRDLQIDNIRSLYEYDIREADSAYEVAITEIKDRLLEQLQRRIEKLKHDRKIVENNKKQPKHTTTIDNKWGSYRSGRTTALAAVANINSSKSSDQYYGTSSSSSSSLRSGQQAIKHGYENSLSLNLSEEDCLSDLSSIMKDLKKRAAEYAALTKQSHQVTLNVEKKKMKSIKKDGTDFLLGLEYCLKYNHCEFNAGSPISLHSKLSGQDFVGVVSRVDPMIVGEPFEGEMLVRLLDGTFCRVKYDHLRTGKLSLKQVVESLPPTPIGGSFGWKSPSSDDDPSTSSG